MSMMAYLVSITPAEAARIRSDPKEAVAYFNAQVDRQEQRLREALARRSPELLAQYEQGRRELAASVGEETAFAEAPTPPAGSEVELDLGKSWHLLHYIMTDDVAETSSPAGALLCGGDAVGEDFGYGPMRLQNAAATAAFGRALESLSTDELLERFDAMDDESLHLYPLHHRLTEAEAATWRDEVLSRFCELKTYVTKAARAGNALLIWLS